MKKILKVSAIIILVLILILALVPFFFQDQIEQNLKDNINKNLNAKVEWSDLNLSLLADFPNAEVSLENVSIINYKPFEGDTLFSAKNFELHMGLLQLFSPESLIIDDVYVCEANINILINKEGLANYDIQKPKDTIKNPTKENKESDFNLELQSYEISNSNIRYKEDKSL